MTVSAAAAAAELVETPTHSFRAKDGKFYASYNEMVQANIKANEAFLVEKGLDNASMQRLKQSANKKPAAPAAASKKRPAASAVGGSNNNNNNDQHQPPPPRRRSTRTKTPVVSDNNESSSSLTSSGILLEGDNIDSIDKILERQEQQRQQTKQQKQAAAKSASSRSRSSSNTSTLSPSLADRSKLQHLPAWVQSMATYLLTEEHLSVPNQRSVMLRVEKLAAGVGVEYQRWGSNNVFMQGVTVDLSMDFDSMHEQAKEFEDKHGKDLGNGWAIRHPIKKLANFQRYCLEHEGEEEAETETEKKYAGR